MSVINTMLQDLERRNAGGGAVGAFRYVRPLPEAHAGRWGPAAWIGAGLGGLLLSMVVAVWMPPGWTSLAAFWRSPGSAAATPPGPAATPLAAVAPVVAVPVPTLADAPAAGAPQGLSLAVSSQLMLRDPPVTQTRVAQSLPSPAVVTRPVAQSARSVLAGSPAARDPASGVPQPALAAKLTAALSAPAAAALPEVAATQVAATQSAIKQVNPHQRAENAFRQASEWLQQGDTAAAMEGLTQVLAMDPLHDGARQALTGILLRAKNNAEAERLLAERLALAPNHAGFAITLARLQVDRGDTDVAIETLRATLPAVRANPAYHATLAALLARREQHVQAVAQYQAALRLAPQAGLWWMGLGLSLQATGHPDDAREALRRARASGDLSPEIAAYVDQRLKQMQ